MAKSDVQSLVDRIRGAGYDCALNNSGHWQVTGTEIAGEPGRMYGVFAATPGSSRSLANSIADLSRATGTDFRTQRKTPPKGRRAVPNPELDPRRIALLKDRDRNNAAMRAAEAAVERRDAAITPSDVAALKARLESSERHTEETKEQRDAAARATAVESALAEPPAAASGHKKYPVLQPPRLVTFSVGQMQELLAVTVCNTRPLQRSVVRKYMDLMDKDLWRVTHQGVAIDWHGCLVDGRQRFTAAVQLGIPLTIFATYGVDPATFFAMDTGKTRTATDMIAMADIKWWTLDSKGNQKEMRANRVSLAAAVALCLNLDYRHPQTGAPLQRYEIEHRTPSKEEIVAALATMHEGVGGYEPGPYYDLGNYTYQAASLKRDAMMTMTAAYAALFMAHRAYPNAPHDEWLFQVTTGANLSERAPALKLRNALVNAAKSGQRANSRGGLTTLAQYAIWIKAWNLFLTGRDSPQIVKWRGDEDVPEPLNPSSRKRGR